MPRPVCRPQTAYQPAAPCLKGSVCLGCLRPLPGRLPLLSGGFPSEREGEPEILILDDSASALDFATDAALRQAIAKFSAERGNRMTTIIVSQRANTVRYADQIVVLDDGKAAGIGTHEQLLESCQTYREIYWSQNERQEAVAQKGGER